MIRDDRGAVGTQLAALILAPILMVLLASAALSVMRTGQDLSQAVQRSTLASVMLSAFKANVALGAVKPVSGTAFAVDVSPATLPAGALVPATLPSVCVTTTWEYVADGALVTLRSTRVEHADATCTSAAAGNPTVQTLPGLTSSARFSYTNRYGRTLSVSSGSVTAGAGTAPVGVSPAQWDDTAVGTVMLDAIMQQLFGTHELRATAVAGR